MNRTLLELDALVRKNRQFLQKGGLCVGLFITKKAQTLAFPVNPESLRTEQGGQVAGLGNIPVQRILAEFGITQELANEGGRTSRGSLGLMEAYVKVLNSLHEKGILDLKAILDWWIQKVRQYFASAGPKFNFDLSKAVASNLSDLFNQAVLIQKNSGGSNYVGAMLQHMVGAKLDIVLGKGIIKHHGFSVADQPTARRADFEVHGVAIHVTTHPSEALIKKAAANLAAGLRPLVVTMGDGVEGASYLLKETEWKDRIDVLDATQFLTANVYERGLFDSVECKTTLKSILERYNEIVAECETDPVLKITLA